MITKVIKIDGDDHAICESGDIRKRVEYYGLSADTKPVEGVNNADIFYEMDTKKAYLFDESGAIWLEQ
jgi:hypothetical protein